MRFLSLLLGVLSALCVSNSVQWLNVEWEQEVWLLARERRFDSRIDISGWPRALHGKGDLALTIDNEHARSWLARLEINPSPVPVDAKLSLRREWIEIRNQWEGKRTCSLDRRTILLGYRTADSDNFD